MSDKKWSGALEIHNNKETTKVVSTKNLEQKRFLLCVVACGKEKLFDHDDERPRRRRQRSSSSSHDDE